MIKIMIGKLRIFFITFLLILLPLGKANASSNTSVTDVLSSLNSIIQDDSCVPGIQLMNALLSSIVGKALFVAYSANFYMEDAPGTTGNCDPNYYNGSSHDSASCAPGASGCTSNCDPRGGARICYQFLQPDLSYKFICWDVNNGWTQIFLAPPAVISVLSLGDKLCVYFWTIFGPQAIGCKYLPDCSKFAMTNSCFLAQSCGNQAYQNSKAVFAISGSIVQCISDSISRLFINYNGCANSTVYQTNSFPVFQDAMRSSVRAAFLLYIIFFGIKMALGTEFPNKSEFFMFVAKFVLVLYFSVGIQTSQDPNGNAVYDDGVTTLMLPFFQSLSTTLTDIVYSAGGNTTLCNYSNQTYPTGYQYLSMWDSIDCRILYYLGFDYAGMFTGGSASGAAGVASVAVLSMEAVTFPFFSIFLMALFGFQIMFAVFSLVFVLLFLSLIIYLLNITIIAMIASAILIYMAPIFVPLALFHQTKDYFEGWLKLVISYSLQPMVAAAYIAMILTIFDQTMYGTCVFTETKITLPTTNTQVPFFTICDPGSGSCDGEVQTSVSGLTSCSKTIGWLTLQPFSSYASAFNMIFFSVNTLNSGVAQNMLNSLTTLCLLGFLFYKFADVLSQFAAELTGGTNLGNLAGRPTETFDKVMSAIVKYATTGKPPIPGKEEVASKVAQKAGGGGGGGTTPRATASQN